MAKIVASLIAGIYVFKANKELALSVLRSEGIKGPQYGSP